jgi:regulator of protease activity HflC (stomatin/prohibitin superfamily)
MAFGEVLSALLGWLGDFVQWVFNWVPRYVLVYYNERAVKYVRGKDPVVLEPGIRWYVAATTLVVKHTTQRCTLQVATTSLETKDGQAVQIGLVLTYHIKDVYVFEVENDDPEENMAVVAEGSLRDIVLEHSWEDLAQRADEGSRFEGKLKNRLEKALQKFGVEVETARPTDQIRLDRSFRLFNGV